MFHSFPKKSRLQAVAPNTQRAGSFFDFSNQWHPCLHTSASQSVSYCDKRFQ